MNSTDTHTEVMTHTEVDHAQPPTEGGAGEVHRRLIESPLAGVDLTEADDRLVTWLASWDCDIVDGISRLLHRARRSGHEDYVSAADPAMRGLLRFAPEGLEDDILHHLVSFQRIATAREVER